ncbi:hypothetical protein HAX54_040574, partial [Datura stramonium]|nr:hypothetical protein [Datura stramonium]
GSLSAVAETLPRQRPTVMDQEVYRRIRCGGVLGTIVSLLQQKYDHYRGQREA